MSNSYVESNRWYITSSKIKLYMQSKEAYKKVYIDEVDTSFLWESKALENGTMVDQFILTPEEFEKNYVFPGWTLKPDLIRACEEKGIYVWTKDTVSDLKEKLYGDKQVLTDKERKMLEWIRHELQRQPLFDFDWGYEAQKELVVEYKGFKLKWTLDRVSVEKKMLRDLKTSKDVEYSAWKDMTYFEDALIHNDQYQYWLQIAFYWILCKIHYWEEFDCIIDAVKTTGNYAYEWYIYYAPTIKKIALQILFPALDQLIEDTKNDNFVDVRDERWEIINNRYYPILDSAIQKEFRVIEPAFY